jgi:hypothetical protein
MVDEHAVEIKENFKRRPRSNATSFAVNLTLLPGIEPRPYGEKLVPNFFSPAFHILLILSHLQAMFMRKL